VTDLYCRIAFLIMARRIRKAGAQLSVQQGD